MNRTFLIIAMAACCWLPSVARADEVVIKGMPAYTGVRVTGVKGADLLFEAAGGNPIQHGLAKVVSVKLTGQDSFNTAESDLAGGKPAEAVKAYDQAADRATEDWMKRLVAVRRVRALDRAGMVERATREWLTLVEQMGRTDAAVAFHPTQAAAKGSDQNKVAIAQLEDKLKRVKEASYAAAIKELLAELYRVEGMTDKLKALGLTGQTGTTGQGNSSSGKNGTSKVPAPSASEVIEKLRAAADALAKDPGRAVALLEPNLKYCSPSELSAAMLLLGKAQMNLSETESKPDEQRRLQLEAGLNFMRVAVFYGGADEAGEALYLAGVMNERLKNTAAAKAAYEKVISGWPELESAAKAKAALERLRKPPTKP